MPKLRNPAYVAPVAAVVTSRKAGIQTYLVNNAEQAEIDFDQIRADFPALAAAGELTDGNIAEICKALSIQVED